jgi:hypothetical protein
MRSCLQNNLPRVVSLALVLTGVAGCVSTRRPTAESLPLPAAADLRPRFAALGLSPKDQSPRGCCSLFAINGVFEFELATAAPAQPPVRLSEEYLNWASHQTNGRQSDGSFFADALRGIATFGVCREELMPYTREFRPDVPPSEAAVLDAASRRGLSEVWIKPWDVTTGMSAAMLTALRRELAAGHPVAVGLRWPKQETYGADGLLVVPPPEQVFDGHSIVLVGYRDDAGAPGGGVFTFRNSFGANWREGGYGCLPYAYAAAYGNDAVALRPGGTPLPCNLGARSPIEFEAFPGLEARGCQPSAQSMAAWGAARWSGGAQLFCPAAPGAAVTVPLPSVVTRRVQLSLFATRAPDFGIVRVFLDDRPRGRRLDLYAAAVQPTGRLALGTAELAAGPHRLRVEPCGRNPAATGTFFGLDCLELVPVEP